MALVRHSLTPLLAILDFRNSIESVGSDVPCSLFLSAAYRCHKCATTNNL